MKARLEAIPDLATRQLARERIRGALHQQQADQQAAVVETTLSNVMADPTWNDLVSIPDLTVALSTF